MEKLEIEIPQGHEIDQEKSDLTKGLVVFKKVEKKWPTSWEDLKDIGGYFTLRDSSVCHPPVLNRKEHNKNMFPTKQDADSSLAEAQLLQLRKAYIGDWDADWSFDNNVNKYCVERHYNKVIVDYHSLKYEELSFPKKEMAEHFLKHHEELLKVYFKIK